MTHTLRLDRRMLALVVAPIAIGPIGAIGAGCGGQVTVDGAFGDRPLDVAGTGFGWVDLTQYVADTSGGTPVLQNRPTDDVLLHLVFTQASFDPSQDFHALPAGERAAIEDDIARGDQLRVDVRRGDVIRPGDELSLVKNDGSLPPEVLPFLSNVDVLLGVEAVGATDRYPDHAPRVGSDRTAKLHVQQTVPELVGVLDLTAQKAKGETDGFVEGTVHVHFGFSLLPERLAECNFAPQDAGAVDPCTLQDTGTSASSQSPGGVIVGGTKTPPP